MAKAKKKHLTSIHTHKAHDGGFVHEHHYRDDEGNQSSAFGGVSSDMADLHQHMDDHLGPGADQGEPDQDDQAAAAAQPGPPQAQ